MIKHFLRYISLTSILFLSCGEKENIPEEKPNPPETKPTITILIPNSGSVGDDIQIIGQNFGIDSKDVQVLFGETKSTIKEFSKDKLTVSAPSLTGSVNVNVKVKDQFSNYLKFTYKVSEEKGKLLSNGLWVPLTIEEASGFKGVSHIRLKNGNIFTLSGNNATVSSDEGKTWTYTQMMDTQKYGIASPECIETKNGVIIVAFMNVAEKKWTWNNSIYDAPGATLPTCVVRSLDGGKTWQNPLKLHDDWTGAIRSIIETKDGNVVFTSMMLKHNPGRHVVLTYSSKDDGANWIRSNILDNEDSRGHHAGLMESTVVQLKDNRIWHLIRTNWGFIYESFSKDDGLTWSAPQKTNIDASSSPHSLIRLKSGRLVLVWNRMFAEGKSSTPLFGGEQEPNLCKTPASWMRHQLSIMFSDDDGTTWSKSTVIAKLYNYNQPATRDSKGWIAYPHLFEIEPGILMITTESGGLRVKLKETDF